MLCCCSVPITHVVLRHDRPHDMADSRLYVRYIAVSMLSVGELKPIKN